MARKTLKKGGSHHKKTAKKGGSHHKKTAKKGGMDDYIPKPGLMTKAYRMAANAFGHKTKGQKGDEEYAQIVAKQKADEEALAKKIAENEKIIEDDNNPKIDGRTIYSMVIKKEKTPDSLTGEEKNLIDNGHFYQYSDYDMRLIDLGKATKTDFEGGQATQGIPVYMVKFCKDGNCSLTDVAAGSKNYTFRYRLPAPPAPPMNEQPGGYLKKNKDSKKSKAKKGSKKNKNSPK
jgi:hypothetical protein